jgi:hypothetical protein
MPYREPTSSTDVERVELLRFAPQSRRWIGWAALSTSLAIILGAAWFATDSNRPWMLLGAWLLSQSLSKMVRALKNESPVVVALERDGRGRTLTVRRRILGFESARRWFTEETPALIVLEQRAAGNALSITAAVVVDQETTVALFESASVEDARAFRAESWHFTRRALRMPGEAIAREARSEGQLDEGIRDEIAQIVERDDANALRAHIERGVAVDARVEFESMTLVDFAATRGAARCVRALIELGADASPHTLSLAGYCAPTPRGDERERYLRHVEVVRVLIDAGVDPEADNREGVPARLALEDAGPEMAEFVAFGGGEP